MADNNINLLLQLQTERAQENLQAIQNKINEFSQTPVDLKLGKSDKEAAKLTSEFSKAQQNAKRLVDQQKQLVAALALTGKTGTKEFQLARKELDKAKDSALQFDKALRAADPETLKNKLSGLGSVMKTIIGPLAAGVTIGAGFKGAADLDQMTQRIKTLGGEAKELAPILEKMNLQMSKDLPIDAISLQTAAYDALSAGISATEEDMSAFLNASAKLAVGGLESVGNTVNILSSLVNAYGAEASDAARFSDILTNSVNEGKTTIQEMNAALPMVVPNAAAFGISLDNITGSLAQMTKAGIPTQQAATKLNQLFLELANPSEQLAPILREAGVSLESLANDDVPVTLAKITEQLKKTGQSTEVFSSSESKAAFASLTQNIDGFGQTLSNVQNITGSADASFAEMSDSMTNKVEQLKNISQSTLIELAQNLAPPLIAVLEKITPVLKTMSEFVGNNMGVTIGLAAATKLLSLALSGKLSIMKENAIGYATSTKAMLAKATASKTTAIATGGLTKAFNVMKVAMATNPIGAVLLAVTALAAAVTFLTAKFGDNSKEQIKAEDNNQRIINSKKELNQREQDEIQSKIALTDEYKRLGSQVNRTAEEERKYQDVQIELEKIYPGVIDKSKDFSENLNAVEASAGKSMNELKRLLGEMSGLDAEFAKSRMRLLELQQTTLLENATDSIDRIAESTVLGMRFGLAQAGDAAGAFGKDRQKIAKEIEDNIAAIRNAANEEELTKALAQRNKLSEQNREFFERNSEFEEKYLTTTEELYANRAEYISLSEKATQKVAENSSAKQQEIATDMYAKLTSDVAQYTANYAGLSQQVRGETEKTLKDQINTHKGQLRITDEQANSLFLQIEANKAKNKTERTGSRERQIDADKEFLQQLKAQQAQDMYLLSIEKRKREILRLEENRMSTLADEQLETIEIIRLYDVQIKQITDAMAKMKPDSDGFREAQKELDTMLKTLENAELDLRVIELKAELESDEVRRQIQEITSQRYSIQLDYAIEDNDVQAVIENRKLLIGQLESELKQLSTDIENAAKTDEAKFEELTTKKLESERELNNQRKALIDDYRTAEIASITDTADYKRQLAIRETERQLQEDLKQSAGSRAAELIAYQTYRNTLTEIDNEYFNARANTENELMLASKALYDGFLTSTYTDRSKEIEKERNQVKSRIKTLQDEQKELKNQLKSGELNVQEYHKKHSEIAGKIEEENNRLFNIEADNSSLNAVAEQFNNALISASQVIKERSEKNIADALQSFAFYKDEVTRLDYELNNVLQAGTDEYEEALLRRQSAEENANESMSKLQEQMLVNYASTLTGMIVTGKNAGKEIVMGLFTMLEQMVPIIAAQILGLSLAQYDSVMSFGAVGFARAALLTGALRLAVAVAKNAVSKGFKKGGYTGDGNANETAGNVHKGEFVFTKSITKKNRKDFEKIHREKLSMPEYIMKYASDLLPGAFPSGHKIALNVSDNSRVNRYYQEYSSELKKTNKLMRKNIEATKELKTDIRRRTKVEFTGKLRTDKNSIFGEIESYKQLALNRS